MTAPLPGGLREATLDEAACRTYFRKLAAGVAVVTACGPAGWAGTTVSTLTSVSMAPPIVLCCVTGGSRTLTAIQHSGCFAVHLLGEEHRHLADQFSRPPSTGSRFEDLGHEVRMVRGAPTIGGTLAVGWCDLHAYDEVGDHVVVYGRLAAVQVGAGRPLLWHERAYRRFREPTDVFSGAGRLAPAQAAASLSDGGVPSWRP